MLQHLLDASELSDEFLRRFLADARTAGNVVGRVSHQTEHVDDLRGRVNIELSLDGIYPHDLKFMVAVFGAVHEDTARHQLTVVLVGSHHISRYAAAPRFGSQCTDDVVGFISRYLQNRNPVGLYDFFNNRNREADGLRSLFPLGFILLERFVPEGRSCRVEGNADMARIFLFQHVFQRIYEAHDGRCIKTFRIDTGILDKSIIGTVYQCVCIQ